MILTTKLCKKYCNLIAGNAELPIETVRWFNISRENRICKLQSLKRYTFPIFSKLPYKKYLLIHLKTPVV